jgi:hypothetical protein
VCCKAVVVEAKWPQTLSAAVRYDRPKRPRLFAALMPRRPRTSCGGLCASKWGFTCVNTPTLSFTGGGPSRSVPSVRGIRALGQDKNQPQIKPQAARADEVPPRGASGHQAAKSRSLLTGERWAGHDSGSRPAHDRLTAPIDLRAVV